MQTSDFMRWQALTSPEAQVFLQKHTDTPLDKLALQKNKFPQIPFPEVLEQLDAMHKLGEKIPAWANAPLLLLPSLAFQQASSALTAQYKSELIEGERVADLTGGLGVDTFFLAQNRSEVWHIERQEGLQQIVQHNFTQLGQHNVQWRCQNTEDFLEGCPADFDAFYIDPARRGQEGQKLVLLADYSPNVLELLPAMFAKARQVWLKTSPLLDIQQAIQALRHVEAVYVIAHGQEVKELLFQLLPLPTVGAFPPIHAVTLDKHGSHRQGFTYSLADEARISLHYGEVLRYVYEPLPAILKAGGFKSFAERYQLTKLHAHSHLYTSDVLDTEIPARIFEVQQVCSYKKEVIKKALPAPKAHILVRNFRDSVAQIRQKLHIAEGGEQYLLATTLASGEQKVLITQRIQKNIY